ncbi:MBG domain-containing protein [Marasmitruncus massiliensis]|uniref:MBG domain-containing protein n=1 Tax=Marasmitruncus massiliensis TaxID=1944642 RepID=UPI000C7C6914|nr:MBG domain-containing protein [Marasmitruncus massiliensis]
MLRFKRTARICFLMILLLLAALAGGLPVFAAEELPMIPMVYGDPVPPLPENIKSWDKDPGDKPNAETYTYTLSDGTTGKLIVSPCPITVTPDSKTKKVGEADPVLTYQITSASLDSGDALVFGDTLSGALTRVSGESVGSYSILQGELTNEKNPNYAITFVAGRTLTITADSSIHDVTVSVKYGDSFSSNGKMPDQSYGTSTTADLSVTLYQETPNKSASLQFDAELSGGGQPATPVTLFVALPSNFSKSKEYYVRRTYDDSDSRLSADIERHGDYYFVVFTTSVVDDATFRVIRNSSDDDDDDYKVSSFWEDVIDDIADADYGDRIRVSTGTRTTVAADVLRELKGLPITLSLKRSNGQVINIYGKDIGYISSGKDSYTMTELAREYDSSVVSSSSFSQVPSSSQAVSSSCVQESSAPAVPVVQTWTPAPPPVSSSLPEASSSEPSSSVPEELSSSETEEDEESEIEIIAEEDEPYVDADGESDDQTAGSVFYPFFVVGSLSAAGILAGVVTAIACRSRR